MSESRGVPPRPKPQPDVVVYGGPFEAPELNVNEDSDDDSQTSVNSAAIDALLSRIEETKQLLQQPSNASDDVANHNRLSQLLANLASAAEAMQRFDELEASGMNSPISVDDE